MKLSVSVVYSGKYIRAGDDLPSDFILPEHLEAFIIDEPPLPDSRVDHRFTGHGAATRLANLATDYPKGEEEFTPKWEKMKKHALKKKGKED